MKVKGNIVTPFEIFYGEIEFSETINSIKKISKTEDEANWILPGFIDLHVHGGGGSDVMQGEDSIRNMLKCHSRFGTTSLLATTVTDKHQKLVTVFKDIANVMSSQNEDEANLLGVHLEGPYLCEHKLGAQPNYIREFDIDEVLELHSIAPIKIITIAPESNISDEEIQILKNKNTIIQIGHSNVSYESAVSFLKEKANSVTHLFNAMSPFHHRNPGLAGACLAHANTAELIPDLLHVHPGAIEVALRAIPDLYFVTDSTAACAMPDGEYMLGEHKVSKCGNGIRLKDGTLAGSSLTMLQALKNIHSLNLSMKDAVRRLSSIQARLLNLTDRGELSLGKKSDILVINTSLDLVESYINGRQLSH